MTSTERATIIYQQIKEAGMAGIPIKVLLKNNGIGRPDAILASLEAKGLRLAELDGKVFAMDAFMPENPKYNKDYDYYINRYR